MIRKMVIKTLHDQYIQNFYSNRDNSSKARNYLYLKDKWEMEFYLTALDANATRNILYFRTCNNKLPIEKGRHVRPKIPAHERYCPYCLTLIGDTFHYLLECTKFKNQRKKYIDKKYTTRPNMYKFHEIMQSTDVRELRNVASFVNIILKNFK